MFKTFSINVKLNRNKNVIRSDLLLRPNYVFEFLKTQ